MKKEERPQLVYAVLYRRLFEQ
jgi:alpha-ketoglutarate-dependent taurine dioxygenase